MHNIEFNTFDIFKNINHSPLRMNRLIVGCYYPQLLMWYTILKFNGIDINKRVKIFQMEWITKHVIDKILKSVLLWIANDNNNIIEKYFDHHKTKYFEKHVHHRSSFIPRSIKLENTKLKLELDQFYQTCNQKLYLFLEQHSNLLLLDIKFNFSSI